MKRIPASQQPSRNSRLPPEGQVLKVSHHPDGLSQVKLDSGIPHTITIVTRSEDLGALLGTDLAAIRAHLLTRQPGHFRRKAVTKP